MNIKTKRQILVKFLYKKNHLFDRKSNEKSMQKMLEDHFVQFSNQQDENLTS